MKACTDHPLILQHVRLDRVDSDKMLCQLAFETRIGPKVFTAKTFCKLLLSSLDKAVSADTSTQVATAACLKTEAIFKVPGDKTSGM